MLTKLLYFFIRIITQIHNKILTLNDQYLTLTWIYVFTLIIVITFAIEIGQGITHTGTMDFDDILAGIAGFLLMYIVLALLITTIQGIRYLSKKPHKRN